MQLQGALATIDHMEKCRDAAATILSSEVCVNALLAGGSKVVQFARAAITYANKMSVQVTNLPPMLQDKLVEVLGSTATAPSSGISESSSTTGEKRSREDIGLTRRLRVKKAPDEVLGLSVKAEAEDNGDDDDHSGRFVARPVDDVPDL